MANADTKAADTPPPPPPPRELPRSAETQRSRPEAQQEKPAQAPETSRAAAHEQARSAAQTEYAKAEHASPSASREQQGTDVPAQREAENPDIPRQREPETPATGKPAEHDLRPEPAHDADARQDGDAETAQRSDAEQVALAARSETARDSGNDEGNQERNGAVTSEKPDRAEDTRSEPATYSKDDPDLRATGRKDPTYQEEFYADPQGKNHFIGDRWGTSRNSAGRLNDADGNYVSDSSPRPTAERQERAERDLNSRRTHEPRAGAGENDDRVLEVKAQRDGNVDNRDAAWERLEPITEKLADNGIALDKSSTRIDNKDLFELAEPHLSPIEQAQLREGIGELTELNRDIKSNSESLGVAGGSLAIEREFPTALTVTEGSVGERGTSGNFDRVAVMMDETDRAVIVVEEKGVNSGLGSALVENTADPDGPKIRAEQGSTSYLRDLLQNDNKLAVALDNDPALRDRMQDVVRGSGKIEYVLARTNGDGMVTVLDFKVDMDRLNRATIELPTNREGA